MKGGGGNKDLRDEAVSEKDATLRKEAVIYVTECAME
jgi:hypothetical protein